MFQDQILLVGLKPPEKRQIEQLLASFDIHILQIDDPQSPDALSAALAEAGGNGISLIVIQITPRQERPDLQIAAVRHRLPAPIPMLMLIDPECVPRIPVCLKAGIDDYWVLPLDDTAFPTRFYVLLECGQASAHSKPQKQEPPDASVPEREPESGGIIQRILERFQDGFHFFSATRTAKAPENFCLLDRWERVREIGSGGFGSVWLVRETKTGRIAVAKIPHAPHLNIRVLRSAAILKRLSFHPNVVQLIDVIKEQGKIILVQEFISGTTLQVCLENGIPPLRKESAFLTLLAVLAYAHQHKIIHRDIKPDNIMITDAGELKLLDFGLARDLSHHTISDTGYGTRPYMAPEQILGKSCVASDIWALGVLLFILSTNAHPFYHQNEKYLMDAIMESPPPSPTYLVPKIPAKLESIILKCLEKSPDKRYPDAGELRRDLLAGLPRFGSGEVLPDLPPL